MLKALLFADDITLFASADKLEEFILLVNLEFQKAVTFLRLHQMHRIIDDGMGKSIKIRRIGDNLC